MKNLGRYARQLCLPEIGSAGQKKIGNSKVLLVGAGGLGTPLGLYLAASGIGTLGIVEYDIIEESNLQRQVIFKTKEVGEKKLASLSTHLRALNPTINIISHDLKLDQSNALAIMKNYDFVVDGSDNFKTRYLINDASYFLKRPLISGSIQGFEGQLSVFNFNGGPCYRCLYPSPPQSYKNCVENGVLGVVPGIMGPLMALEVLKIILGIGEVINGKVLYLDSLYASLHSIKLKKNKHCQLCGKYPSLHSVKEIKENRDTSSERLDFEISYDEFMASKEKYYVIDIREDYERNNQFIPNSKHIPLSKLPLYYSHLKSYPSLLIYCQTGERSLQACKLLETKKIPSKSLAEGFKGFTKSS